jgi:hypothetical protein
LTTDQVEEAELILPAGSSTVRNHQSEKDLGLFTDRECVKLYVVMVRCNRGKDKDGGRYWACHVYSLRSCTTEYLISINCNHVMLF